MGRKEPRVEASIWNVGTEVKSLYPVVTIGNDENGYRAGYVFPTCAHRHRKWERAADCAIKEGIRVIEKLNLGEPATVPQTPDKGSR